MFHDIDNDIVYKDIYIYIYHIPSYHPSMITIDLSDEERHEQLCALRAARPLEVADFGDDE